MYKLPKSFKLFGYKWKVIKTTELEVAGESDLINKIIYINETLDDDEMSRTFLHEACHAILGTFSFLHLEEHEEEFVCELIAHGILQIFSA